MHSKCVLCLVALLISAVGASAAPTPAEVKAATALGVSWLAGQQNVDGSWGPVGSLEQEAVTAFVLLKLEHHAVDPKWGLGLTSPFDPANPYRTNIEKGLAWLLPRGLTTTIGVQPAGNPDSNNNGIAVTFGWEHHRNYATSLALMAVCQAVEHTRTVAAGPLTGRTLLSVAQDMMDYLSFGQSDAGVFRGGWGYYANYVGFADNSNSGYVTLALGYAEAKPPVGCGLTLPSFVKPELSLWIDYIQSDIDGGSGYAAPENWPNLLKTGNLLQQMALVGDTPATLRVQRALSYLQAHWMEMNDDPGWRGWGAAAQYQATFTLMKGLTALSINKFGNPEIDWQSDFETALIAQQVKPAGNWPPGMWDTAPPLLSTVWALLTLQRAAPVATLAVPLDIHPTSCPNPINLKSKGVLPVAIAGTADLDVTRIDPATVKLEGVAPLRWSYEDVITPYSPFLDKKGAMACNTLGGDTRTDLSLKFDTVAVAAALKQPVTDREVRILKLTGTLKAEFGATPIAGEDVVILLVK